MKTQSHRISDVDQVLAADPLAGEYVQLTRGDLGMRAVEVSGEDFHVRLLHIGQTLHLREALISNDLFFAMITRAQLPTLFNGSEILPGEGVALGTGRECDVVIPGGSELLDVRVRSGLARAIGWKNTHERLCVASPGRAGELASLMSSLSERLSSGLNGGGTSPGAERLAHEVIASAEELVDVGLAGRGPSPSGRSYRDRSLVRKAIELIDGADDAGRISVAQLARATGVSQRTLHYAFKNTLGTSPYRYLLLRKLARVRHALLNGDRSLGAVTRAANEAGFDHLSRMTEMYRRQFGETPRETLRRRK